MLEKLLLSLTLLYEPTDTLETAKIILYLQLELRVFCSLKLFAFLSTQYVTSNQL
jgi:hypothetical protein